MRAFRNKRVLGLQVTGEQIRLAELGVGPGGVPELKAAASFALPRDTVVHGEVQDEEALATAIRTAYASAVPDRFSTKDVYLVLPDFVTYFHIFSFPGNLGDKEIQNALSVRIEDVIPFGEQEVEGHFVVASRGKEETVVQYSVAPKSVVAALRRAVGRADLSLAGFVLEAQALSQLFTLSEDSAAAGTLVVDVTPETATLFVVDGSGIRATFSQPVGIAPRAAAASTRSAERLPGKRKGKDAPAGLSDRQRELLAERIGEIEQWYARSKEGATVSRVLLLGESAGIDALRSDLVRLFAQYHPGMSVLFGNPLSRIAPSAVASRLSDSGQTAAYAQAIGAGLVGTKSSRAHLLFEPGQGAVAPATEGQGFSFISMPIRASGKLFGHASGFTRVRFASAAAAGFFLFALAGTVAFWTFAGSDGPPALAEHADAPVSEGFEAFALTLSGDASVASVTLPLRLISLPDARMPLTILPLNAEQVEGFAAGTVEITNESAEVYTLVEGTRLLTPDDVLFRLDGRTRVGAGETVDAAVRADLPGHSGDIGPSEFRIPGLPEDLQAIVFAHNVKPMNGGREFVGSYEEADRDAVRLLARQKAAAFFADLVAAELTEGEQLLDTTLRAEVLSETTPLTIGAPAREIPFEVSLAVDAVAYEEATLIEAVRSAVADRLGLLPERVGNGLFSFVITEVSRGEGTNVEIVIHIEPAVE